MTYGLDKIPGMEKRTAHYNLDAIKAMVARYGLDTFTRTAREGAARMGLNGVQAVDVVLGLTRSMLYKSMTTYANHREWQDVYHAPCPNGRTAYLKLTLREQGNVVIQFKEL